MGYGVNNQWAPLRGRAKSAGSSRGRSTRTAKRRRSASARRARKSTSRKRRSLLEKITSRYVEKPEGSGHIWDTKTARFVGWS